MNFILVHNNSTNSRCLSDLTVFISRKKLIFALPACFVAPIGRYRRFGTTYPVPFLRVQQSKNVKNGYFVQIILLFLDRALLEKLIVPHLVKELPASYGNQNSLSCPQKSATGTSWATRTIPHTTLIIFTTHFNITLSFPVLSKWSLYFGISHQNRLSTFLFHACYTPRLSPKPLSMLTDTPTNETGESILRTRWRVGRENVMYGTPVNVILQTLYSCTTSCRHTVGWMEV